MLRKLLASDSTSASLTLVLNHSVTSTSSSTVVPRETIKAATATSSVRPNPQQHRNQSPLSNRVDIIHAVGVNADTFDEAYKRNVLLCKTCHQKSDHGLQNNSIPHIQGPRHSPAQSPQERHHPSLHNPTDLR